MKQMGAGVLAFAGALLLMGQACPNRTIDAEKFVLRDSSGVERAELGMENGDRPTLTLRNATGFPLVSLAGGADPFLVLNRADSKAEVQLTASEGLYGLVLYGGHTGGLGDGARAALAVTKTGPALTLHDEKGNERAVLQLDEMHHPASASAMLFGEDSKLLWSTP